MTGLMYGAMDNFHTASTSHLIRWPAVSDTLNHLLQAEEIEFAPLLHSSEADCHLFRPRADERRVSRDDVADVDMPLQVDDAVAWGYVEFYKSSIQNIHPLIPPQDLEDMVGAFLHAEKSESALVLLVFSVACICLWRNKSYLYNPKSITKPGYRYYVHATRLLSTHNGRSDVNFIRAHILASLYCDQLGQVTDSFRHIRIAGAVTLDRLLPHIDRLTHPHEERSLEYEERSPDTEERSADLDETELLVAFWSCWQVEIDLLTDRWFWPSGVLKFDTIRFPTGSALQDLGFSAAVAASYTTHIHLRKQTRKICRLLHNPRQNLDSLQKNNVIIEFEKELKDQNWEPPDLVNSDDPNNRMLLARIRQKFWETKVIAYSPWLEAALDCSSKACPAIAADTMENTRKCIDAMLNSTKAFHAVVEKRSIITNVVGTAHVQFGNLVALNTVLQDPRLMGLIDKALFPEILRKSIKILELMNYSIRGLAIELKVLLRLEQEISGHSHLLTSREPRQRREG